jgi:hypothetical protein|tara:strand:- start:4054 stop:4641 length:588 start_codon:yes stop_codon:yes gene_type:complete
MSVLLNFNIEETDNSKILNFKETTGAYDALNNTDGWGAPNEATTDAVTTTLTITDPSATVTILTSAELAGLASFPNSNTGLILQITPEVIGGVIDSKFTDGLYTIAYEVITATTTYNVTHKVFVSGQARCCVYGMLGDVDLGNCDCTSADLADALEAYTFYRSLIANAACGNETKYTQLLGIISKLCAHEHCSSC